MRILAISVCGWTAVGLLFALPDLAAAREPVNRTLRYWIAQWWAWGLVAALIAAVDRRLPFNEKQLTQRLIAHVPLSLLLTGAYVYLSAFVRAAVGVGPWSSLLDPAMLANSLRGMFLWSWLVYWLITGAWFAKQYYERFLSSELRMERIERMSTEAKLHSLRQQLDPHFLFNALNTISAQVESDPRLARKMIEHLGDLLRLTLESKDRQLVPLSDELAFLDHYLAIQRIRFGDRFKFNISIANDVKHAMIPALLVQPLVENAIRHGISKRSSGGTVWVTASRDGARGLHIEVADDGVGLPPDFQTATASAGVGLSVTRQRVIGHSANGEGSFSVHPRTGGGAAVEIRLPLVFN